MGCASSTPTGYKAQLEEIEGRLDGLEEDRTVKSSATSGTSKEKEEPAPEGEGKPDRAELLKTLEEVSGILKGVFGDVVSMGGRDVSSLRRIELLSERVLNRLTQLSAQSPDDAELKEDLLRIAKVLDSVRATRASTTIEDQYSQRKKETIEQGEVKAKGDYAKLTASFAKLTGPTAVVPNLADCLDQVENVHATAPESTKVTGLLLKNVTSLTEKVLKSQPQSWGKSADEARQVLALSERLDQIANKLVAVMESTWEPPLQPEVAHRIKTDAVRHCTVHLNAVDAQLDNKNPDGAYSHLEQVQPWFDLLPEDQSMVDQVVGAFGSVHLEVVRFFKQAVKTDNAEKAAELRELGKRFDALRDRFTGLPPAAVLNLDEALNAGEIKVRIEKHLDSIASELAKPSPETSALTMALQGIATDWDQVTGEASDELRRQDTGVGLVQRLGSTCQAVEKWAEQVVESSSQPSQWNGLLLFAAEYDKGRKKLTPPQPEAGALRPRIGQRVATMYLKVVQEDLQHPKIPDPTRLLDSLRGAIAAMPKEGDVDDISERLSSALRDTEERVLKGFQEALASGQRRRCNAIKDFAEQFDEVGASSGLVWSLEGASLTNRLEREAERITDQLLSDISSGEDFGKALQALTQLEASKPKSDSALMLEKLPAALASLAPHMQRAAESHLGGSDEDVKAADALLDQATKMDKVWFGMQRDDAKIDSESDGEGEPRERADAPITTTMSSTASEGQRRKLRHHVLGPAVEAHVARAEKLVAAAEPRCAPLKTDLLVAASLCHQNQCSTRSQQRLLDFLTKGETLLLAALLKALAAPGKASSEATDTASAADAALVALGKAKVEVPSGARFLPVVQGAKEVAPILEEMSEEVAKTGGEQKFDPRKIVAGLKKLGPVWSQVSSVTSCEESLANTLEHFRDKIKESSAKNAGSSDALRALFALSKEADDTCEKLTEQTPSLSGLAGFEGVVARAAAKQKLDDIEAELEKAASMNPTALLKGFEALGALWGKLGGESAMDAAFDNVVELKDRVQAIRQNVHDRMVKSMEEARQAGNEGKAKALLKFAGQFDAAIAKMETAGQEGTLGGLKEKMESAPPASSTADKL